MDSVPHLPRVVDRERLWRALGRAPVVLLTGPRQAGKSTLARTGLDRTELAPDDDSVHYFDAEDPRDAARLADPMLALEPLRGTVVIDEAQHLDGLFPTLRVLADRPSRPARFLVLGSASPDLIGLTAESLAGRVEILELGGFRLRDVGAGSLERLWVRGGLPPSFVPSEADSVAWRDSYIATFLERDLAQLGVRVPAATMRRFWTMLAHYHGQSWNGAELARALGVAQTTVRRYLDSLTDALVVRQLQPWFADISKRQVRSPKVYVRESGVLHRLLGIDDTVALERHPKVGASFEGFVVEQISQIVAPNTLYYWRTQHGAELDLYLEHRGRRLGIEIKRTSSPRMTPSMMSALGDLGLDRLVVAYPGERRFDMAERVAAIPVADVLDVEDADELLEIAAGGEAA